MSKVDASDEMYSQSSEKVSSCNDHMHKALRDLELIGKTGRELGKQFREAERTRDTFLRDFRLEQLGSRLESFYKNCEYVLFVAKSVYSRAKSYTECSEFDKGSYESLGKLKLEEAYQSFMHREANESICDLLSRKEMVLCQKVKAS